MKKTIIPAILMILVSFMTNSVYSSDQYTELLIHSDTFNGSTIFTDSSNANHVISVSGNPMHSTDKSKFGVSSIYFDGDDYLLIGDPDDLNTFTDPYTLDFWILQTVNVYKNRSFDRSAGGFCDFTLQIENDSARLFVDNAADNAYVVDISASVSLSDQNWHHIAIVRSTDITTIYIDGVAKVSTSSSNVYDVNSTAAMKIGSEFKGYIDEFRISKGIARWESDFTPPDKTYLPCDYYFQIVDSKGSIHSAVSVPFVITNYSDNTGIEGIDFTIDFDSSVLEAKGITFTGGILENKYLYNVGLDTPGKIMACISAANEPFVLSSGIAGYIQFNVLSENNSNLTISEIIIDETYVCSSSKPAIFDYDSSPALPTDSPIDNKNYATEINTPISITFTVNDPDTLNADLLLSASSSDKTIIPSNNITFSSDVNLITMTISPAEDQYGESIAISITISDGSSVTNSQINLTVNGYYYLAGNIQYYTGTNNPVNNVTLVLSGTDVYTVVSDENGKYSFSNIEPGSYTLVAMNSDELDGLGADDATRIRRYKVHKDVSFNCYQMLAADVSLNGTISALDASRVGIGSAKIDANLEACFQDDSCIHWIFVKPITNGCNDWPPIQRSNIIQLNIESNVQDMNLIGIRLGDTTGNWKSYLYFNGIDDYIAKTSPKFDIRDVSETDFEVFMRLNNTEDFDTPSTYFSIGTLDWKVFNISVNVSNYLQVTGSKDGSSWGIVQTSAIPLTQGWLDLKVTRSSGHYVATVNNTEYINFTNTTDLIINNNEMHIGAHYEFLPEYYFKGIISKYYFKVNGETVASYGCGESHPLTITNSFGMQFNYIPAGTFVMGSPEGEIGRTANEAQYTATISKPFYIQTTEVTQGQWKMIMNNNPSAHSSCGDDCPVDSVTWNDVQAFLTTLNAMGEGSYTLPTEAQWEYAARAGSKGAFANGDITNATTDPNLNLMGWYSSNAGSSPRPVALKQANAWGLFDMHGNMWEWCHDWYGTYPTGSVIDPRGPSSGTERVNRGGGYPHPAQFSRAAIRNYYVPTKTGAAVGFRIIKEM